MGGKTTAKTKAFENRIEELKTFKKKHGHVRVTMKQDESLGKFCSNMRCARRGKKKEGGLSLKIESRHWTSWDLIGGGKTTANTKAFENRIEDLEAFKAKHGHVRVTMKQDKSLGKFCEHMRCARHDTRKGRRVITEDGIKALDELGFE